MGEPTVKDCITKDGGLFNLGWYLSWSYGEERATLDGEFTAKDLRDIADIMDGGNG